MKAFCALLIYALLASPADAESAVSDTYVEANILSIFYHEFGHALIDILGLPVMGQEEDAADTISVLMIDLLNDEETAQEILREAAFGFLEEAASNEDEEPFWWDSHGPNLQRYYNMVCQFYGGNPDTRQSLADDLSLPEDRAYGCEDEFLLAFDSFEPILDDLFEAGSGTTLEYVPAGSSFH